MPTCSSCGGNFDDTFQFCPYCGKAKEKPQEPVKLDVIVHESQSPMNCPKCQRVDSVAKVSAIVQGGTHHIDGEIPMPTTYDSDGWSTGTSYKSYHATQQSALASRLTPPEKPIKAHSGLLNLAPAPFIPFIFVVIMTPQLITAPKVELVQIFWFCLGVIIYALFLFGVWRVCIWIDKPFKAKHAENIAAWEYSISRWRELYYCSRDDCLFIPGERGMYNISDLYSAINWRPVKRFNPLFNTYFLKP